MAFKHRFSNTCCAAVSRHGFAANPGDLFCRLDIALSGRLEANKFFNHLFDIGQYEIGALRTAKLQSSCTICSQLGLFGNDSTDDPSDRRGPFG